jgi:CheY-like chemotaxis protein
MRDAKILEALFPGPRRLILATLFREPDRWFSIPELSRRVGVPPGVLRKHLVCFRDSGIVRKTYEAARTWFQPDPGCPVYAEVQSIVHKTTRGSDERETILVVDDQPATTRITCILLESWGYRVLEAPGAREALGVFEQHEGEIHLLLTDVIMPGMTGTQLASELMRRKPGLRVVFMSGYPAHETFPPGTAFLPKPFNPAGLSRTIRRELDQRVGQGRMLPPR